MYGGVEVQIHIILTSAPDGSVGKIFLVNFLVCFIILMASLMKQGWFLWNIWLLLIVGAPFWYPWGTQTILWWPVHPTDAFPQRHEKKNPATQHLQIWLYHTICRYCKLHSKLKLLQDKWNTMSEGLYHCLLLRISKLEVTTW